MRLMLFISLFIILSTANSYSQSDEYDEQKKKRMSFIPRYPLEIGFSAGTNVFLGDLGGTHARGQAALADANGASVRPAIGVFARYNMGGHFSFRLEMSYLNLAGDDQLTGSNFSGTKWAQTQEGWFRFYRNLNFQSHVFEMTNCSEITPYNFKLTGNRYTKTKQNVLSPYGLLGVGFIVFSPETLYKGTWIPLRELSTEGQGLVEGKDPYSSVQFIIPVGFGLRWEHDHQWVFSLEVNHRFTFTDYLDDVSTDYVDPAVFEANFDANKASLATSLARRSPEIDPNGHYSYITAPGQQRGNPDNNDAYFTVVLRVGFYLKRSRHIALVKDY